ncbi:MAG: hypothetical protein EP332_11060 [Bacteroidetes bacterium]|nr:MAG: hypothetical protein EP332_11060 [Bacteroidota bacterium]
MKFKLQYSKTIQTIYPADEKALERLPHLIAADMDKDYFSNCRVSGNEVDFITTIPFGQDLYQTSLNTALDSGLISVTKSDSGYITIQYKLRFTFRIIILTILMVILAKSTMDISKWPFLFIIPLFYIITFLLAKAAVKSTIENALKYRYR